MDIIIHILENVVRCKYFKTGVHIKNPIKNSYQDGWGRTIQTLDHVVVVHILIWDKRKSQINEYSDTLSHDTLNALIGIVSAVCFTLMEDKFFIFFWIWTLSKKVHVVLHILIIWKTKPLKECFLTHTLALSTQFLTKLIHVDI